MIAREKEPTTTRTIAVGWRHIAPLAIVLCTLDALAGTGLVSAQGVITAGIVGG